MPEYGPPDSIRMELHLKVPVEYGADEAVRLSSGACFKPDTLWLVWRRSPLAFNGDRHWVLHQARIYGPAVDKSDYSRVRTTRLADSWVADDGTPVPAWAVGGMLANDPNDIIAEHSY